MKRWKQHKNITRVYPVYTVSEIEQDNDENVIELKPVERYHRQFRQPLGQERRRCISLHSNNDYQNEAAQKSAFVQTDTVHNDTSPRVNNEKSSTESSSIWTHKCLHLATVILAVFILITSMFLLVFSFNLLLNSNMTKLRTVAIVDTQAVPSSTFSGKGPTDTLLVTAVIGIVLGFIILIISILTIICLISIKFRYHGLCCFCGPILLGIVVLTLLGFAIFILIIGDTELQRLASTTQRTVYYYYNSTTTTLVRDGWDFVQYYFRCCGVKSNNTDWYPAPSTGWLFNSQLPRSCCGYDPNDIGHAGRIFVGSNMPILVGTCYYGDIGQPTCYDSIKTNLLITVLVFLFSFALIILIETILFIALLIIYRKIHNNRIEELAKQ